MYQLLVVLLFVLSLGFLTVAAAFAEPPRNDTVPYGSHE